MKVSIIIPVLNQWRLTRNCLEALETNIPQDIDHEILICDGGSTDETLEALSMRPTVRVIRCGTTPATFAQNCNTGARSANGDVLLFLNNDTLPRPNWLTPMLKVLQTQKNVGFVGNVQWNLRRQCWDHFGIVFEKSGLPHHYGQYSKKDLFPTGFGKWNAVTAACCLIEKTLFRDFGGFDETFQNGCEDVDLCLRLRRQGYENYVAYESRIDHVKCATPGRRDHNRPNLALFRKRWAKSIAANEAVTDRVKVAHTILGKFLKYPWTVSVRQLIEHLPTLLVQKSQQPPKTNS